MVNKMAIKFFLIIKYHILNIKLHEISAIGGATTGDNCYNSNCHAPIADNICSN